MISKRSCERGDLRAPITPNHMKAQIQTRCRACRSENPAVVHIEQVRIHLYLGVPACQFLRGEPIGGRSKSI